MEPELKRNDPAVEQGRELDAGTRSLERALRISFAILTVVMVLLALGYLASGFYTVGPQERAIVLHFGKIHGDAQPPGIHWAWPFPVDEVVKIPATRSQTAAVNTFWYATPSDMADRELREQREEMKRGLKPEKALGAGGYNLTGDLNVINTYWVITYNIDDPIQYYRNVMVQGDVDERQLIGSVIENAVVQAVGGMEVYDALYVKTKDVANLVARLSRQKLGPDGLNSGILIQQVLSSPAPVPPLDVQGAFDDAMAARQDMKTSVEVAKQYRNDQLVQAAGRVALESDDPADPRGLGDMFSEIGDAREEQRQVRETLAASDAEILKLRGSYAATPPDQLVAWQTRMDELKKQVAELAARDQELNRVIPLIAARIDELYEHATSEVKRIRDEATEYKRRLVGSAKGDADIINSLLAKFPGQPDKLRTYLDHYRLQVIEEVISKVDDKYLLPEVMPGTLSRLDIDLTPPSELMKKKRKIEEVR